MWFAFKFLPLQYLRQLLLLQASFDLSCDLLSNSYLCSICDSYQRPNYQQRKVVICFQILTFAVSATAHFFCLSIATKLWFAFKFLPLQYLRQQNFFKNRTALGCDLLSNSYLCSICDSHPVAAVDDARVVICFQILTFAVSATARAKFWPALPSCDLLSNSYLCSICDSPRPHVQPRFYVVICFQILTFAVSATARKAKSPCWRWLWFAFKFLPLQYLRQPSRCVWPPVRGCDLLSNSYLCSICDSSNTTNSWIRDH